MNKVAMIQGEKHIIESAITYINRVSYYVRYKGKKRKLRLGLSVQTNKISYYILLNKIRLCVDIK